MGKRRPCHRREAQSKRVLLEPHCFPRPKQTSFRKVVVQTCSSHVLIRTGHDMGWGKEVLRKTIGTCVCFSVRHWTLRSPGPNGMQFDLQWKHAQLLSQPWPTGPVSSEATSTQITIYQIAWNASNQLIIWHYVRRNQVGLVRMHQENLW